MRWMPVVLGVILLASAANQAPGSLFEPAWIPPEGSVLNKTREGYSIFYTFELNASQSYDPDGVIKSCSWERMTARTHEANGTWETVGHNKSILFNGRNYTEGPEYSFANCYLVFIRLTVTDDKGAVNSTQRTLCSGVFDEKGMWSARAQETPTPAAPAFEVVFSVIGFLGAGYLVRR